jgi:hypothetical protein
MDGSTGWDAAEFRDASGSYSLSEIYESSPEQQRVVERVEDERRRARDCRFSSMNDSEDAAIIGTSRKNVTRTGVR